MKRTALASLAALCALTLLAAAPADAASAPAPAWTISAAPYATNFEAGAEYDPLGPGPAYFIQAYNAGGESTSGEFTLTVTLPRGLLPVAEYPAKGVYGPSAAGISVRHMSCSALGRRVTCTGGGAEGPVGPGEGVSVIVPLDVAASASGTLEAEVLIEGGAGAAASAGAPVRISPDPAPFGFLPGSPFGQFLEADGGPATRAGSHPYAATIAGMWLATEANAPNLSNLLSAGAGLHDVQVELPKGLVIDPTAVPQCREAELEDEETGCPAASQVGVVSLALSLVSGFGTEAFPQGLYNMVPPPGYPAELGFEVVEGTYIHYLGGVKSDGTFTLTAASRHVLAKVTLGGVRNAIWGVPSDASHDGQRARCLNTNRAQQKCPTERTGKPFLTMPSACSGPLTTKVKIDSWLEPGSFREGSYETTDREGNPVGVEGCSRLAFEPQIAAKASTDRGDSPAGLDFGLHMPQSAPRATGLGSTEVCAPGVWAGERPSFSFQWLRDQQPIAGATSRRHEVSEEDAGHSLQCQVAATSEAGTALAASAPLAVPPVPADPAPVAISRPTLHTPSQTLTVTGSSGAYVLSYEGQSTEAFAYDSTAAEIQGALEELESIGEGNVEVTGAGPYAIAFAGALEGSEALFSVSASKTTEEEEMPSPAALSPTLRCDPGTWSGEPAFSYRWLKDGAAIGGETEPIYEVPPGEATDSLQCEVAGANSSGTAVAYSRAAPEMTVPPDIGLSEGDIPLATANLKDATVKLPEGMVLNPSAAAGRQACSASEIGLASAIGASPVRFHEESAHCPDAAKLGTVEVTTPLLDHKLQGAVYLAKPYDNPFDSLLAIYLVVEDERNGVIAKLAGKVEADKATGQLTTTFEENPELPLEDVRLHLFNGARGALTTPLACGTHTTTSTLVPWSTPQGSDVHPTDSFATTGSCSGSEARAPKKVTFRAGSENLLAGRYSPFVMRISRPDGSQRLKSIDMTLPSGLTGRLAGLSTCSEAQIDQAEGRDEPEDGRTEQAHPSCPRGSEVATVTVGAGSGPSPYYVTGHAYLAGPYHGAPISLAIVTPAVAGPFDLGVVVVRVALHIDPVTAQIHAVSDSLPTIIEGIPLDIRSIALKTTPAEFTLNPTSCSEQSLSARIGTATGQSTDVANRFQVGGCRALGFRPTTRLRLFGGVRRAKYQGLRAVVRAKPGDANIRRAVVRMPRSAYVAQEHMRNVCTRVQYAADNCPKSSIYGGAIAYSPLLGYPLRGKVYLRSSDDVLPNLVADLRGPDYQPIRIELAGRIDSVKGALRTTFDTVPDAPVSYFRLQLAGGKKGLIINSRNICKGRNNAAVGMNAHNGRRSGEKVPIFNRRCALIARKAKRRRAVAKRRRAVAKRRRAVAKRRRAVAKRRRPVR